MHPVVNNYQTIVENSSAKANESHGGDDDNDVKSTGWLIVDDCFRENRTNRHHRDTTRVHPGCRQHCAISA